MEHYHGSFQLKVDLQSFLWADEEVSLPKPTIPYPHVSEYYHTNCWLVEIYHDASTFFHPEDLAYLQ